ncbi:MAG: hypothetical protein KIT68_08185 [Phycisphaeraceae bacterium]|nr:hypothetical protein [Phycisphaeraceae bacterium]
MTQRRVFARLGWAGVWIAGVLAGAAILTGCSREDEAYPQDTPDAVLKSAVEMVKSGNARLLPRLLDDGGNRDMRAVLNRLGNLTGSMQSLAKAVAERFPTEVEALRKQVEAEAASEKGQQTLQSILRGPAAPQAGKGPPDAKAQEAARRGFEDTFARLMADPFSFLERGAERLSTTMITDDQAAILFYEKPVLGIGLTMRKRGDKWYVELPLNLPGVRDYMPQTRTEHSIVASLIKVLDGTVKDLESDVTSGRVITVNQLAEKAGERAFVPMGMVALVYVKEMDVRRQRERVVREFSKRLGEWTKARSEEAATVRSLSDTITRLAVEELDKAVRMKVKDEKAHPLPKFEAMAEPEFVNTIQGWLAARKVGVSLAATLSQAEVERLASQVNESLGQIAKARKK